mmetsp:Transcript_32420/g.84168  ORF Transcript_32420/g.84168 Transcript_32420/m.84168 type:complete len:134 (+) Transcript_32420:1687-2088(+)
MTLFFWPLPWCCLRSCDGCWSHYGWIHWTESPVVFVSLVASVISTAPGNIFRAFSAKIWVSRMFQRVNVVFHAAKYEEEKKMTENTLAPVYRDVAKLDQQIEDMNAKVQDIRARISKNDATILKLLESVVSAR